MTGRSRPSLARLCGLALLGAASSAALAPAAAEMLATPLRGDSRLVEFAYDPDNTYLVLAKPKAVTHIQFAGDEAIQSVAAGDTANWEFTPTRNRKNLFVKPRYEGQESSLTVITDKRSYQFVLRSTGDGRKWYQRVSWAYSRELVLTMEGMPEAQDTAAAAAPQAEAPAPRKAASALAAGIAPDQLRFGYEISGDAAFRPRVVFDDGRFTYFKMPGNLQELPALFAVMADKDYSLVNFEVKGDYLVAQRLLPAAVLKLGREEVRVTRAVPRRSFFSPAGEAP
ncbi:TrbG/VirB9 family P-type conjugative transfer protein [Ramlibacter sp. AN1133]|uniref:TrbG/VirB9 family P-type conjugative transfer protein n=1 Tax=Ramlibacter sp. AN1133 TaxID=3133429 RepID=UPI0030C4FE45